MLVFEILDLQSGSVVGAFGTEGEAVRALRQIISRESAETLDALALVSIDQLGVIKTVAKGADEVRRLAATGRTISA